MKSLWGSPDDMKKGKVKTKGKGKLKLKKGSGDPFSNSTSLQDMKTSTLSEEHGGWGKKGVKATTSFKTGKHKKSDKVFKSMGF